MLNYIAKSSRHTSLPCIRRPADSCQYCVQ